MIHVRNLHKKFGKLHVLRGIDEHIKRAVVVICPSGQRILRCLNLLNIPLKGDHLKVFHHRSENDINQLRQKMGIYFNSLICFTYECFKNYIGTSLKRHLRGAGSC